MNIQDTGVLSEKGNSKNSTCSVAIVGAGMRLPGNINTLKKLFDFLMDRGDAVSDPPAGRWSADWYDPSRLLPGTTYVQRGGYVDGLDLIDVDFFGLSSHEASRMDPQHRMLLETSFEALDMAGFDLERVAGRPVGVFVGISSADYMHMQARDPRNANAYTNVGSASSIAANRISYAFNLRGPSLSVDTACSSGLTALHLAVKAIEAGDCESAIVGATNALIKPELFVNFCAASMLSPVGQCRAFDKGGAGFVRAEGAVALVLKPLENAIADEDPVLAVVRATCINNDGRTAGLALPSGEVQAELLRGIYRTGGIDVDEIVYVEAHGTGTQAGDPQEAQALGMVIGRSRSQNRPLPIGSIKTNLGHLEPVSGLVGVLKSIAALQMDVVPPQIHFDEPNPAIDFAALRLNVVNEPLELAASSTSKIGVNSFGFGGANAHVVLERAPMLAERKPPTADRYPIILSGHTPTALRESAAAIGSLLRETPDLGIGDLSATLLARRTWHTHRAVFFASDHEELVRAIDGVANDDLPDNVEVGKALSSVVPAFVFTGNGPQWFGMGQKLLKDSKVYRETVEEVSAIFQDTSGIDLLAEMKRDESTSRMASTDIAQPALFALQLGLVKMLASEGIAPGAVVGHSAGELAAAHVAGIHDLHSIVRLVAARSSQQERTVGEGAMAALGISLSDAEALLRDSDTLVIAGENAADAVTIAGDAKEIDEFVDRLQNDGVFARKLRLNYAFHSTIMDRIEHGFRSMIGSISGQEPEIPFYSTVTGGLSTESLNEDYWWDNLRQPVQFRRAIDSMIEDGHRIFIEVGPHANLAGYVKSSASAANIGARVVETLRRNSDDAERFERAIASMIAAGARVDKSKRLPQSGPSGRVAPIPLAKRAPFPRAAL